MNKDFNIWCVIMICILWWCDYVNGGWEGNVMVFMGDIMFCWLSVDIDWICVIRVDDIFDKGNNLYLFYMGFDIW